MKHYRLTVALAHLGTREKEYVVWHIASQSLTASDLFSNREHVLPGVNRVLEVHAITQAEYETARAWGQKAFRIEPRK